MTERPWSERNPARRLNRRLAGLPHAEEELDRSSAPLHCLPGTFRR